MSHVLCCKLRPMAGRVVRHGFKKAPNRFLIIIGDGSELVYQLLFRSAKKLTKWGRSPAREYICRIYTALFERCHISQVKRACTQLVVFLRAPTDPKKHTKISLI